MDSKEVQFAFEMFRLQLQDALTVVGKIVLNETKEKVNESSNVLDNLDVIRGVMHNPFDEVIKVCSKLKAEYEEYRSSPELVQHLELVKKEMEENPDILDELIEASPEDTTKILERLKSKKDENLQ